MSKAITLNSEQSLYVIPSGSGFSCFGFANARDQAQKIAESLNRSDLLPTPEMYGTLEGYSLYLRAVEAWGASVMSKKTWFGPGTEKKLEKVLEKCRETRKLVRLFVGDPETGRDWCEEWDVVGHVGRSTGTMKVPLLVPIGDYGGSAISTRNVLRIMDVSTNEDLYRHPKYQVPNVRIAPLDDPAVPEYTWAGYRDETLHARFKSTYEAAEWAEFTTGRLATKREEIVSSLRLVA